MLVPGGRYLARCQFGDIAGMLPQACLPPLARNDNFIEVVRCSWRRWCQHEQRQQYGIEPGQGI